MSRCWAVSSEYSVLLAFNSGDLRSAQLPLVLGQELTHILDKSRTFYSSLTVILLFPMYLFLLLYF